jgi:hypothetical protein
LPFGAWSNSLGPLGGPKPISEEDFMRLSLATLTVSILALSAVACGPGLNAPKLADGQKIGIYVVHDRNIPGDADGDKVKMRNQVSDYLEANLTAVLTRYGYEVFAIQAADQFVPGPNKFLLNVKVQAYNPGNKGARVAAAFVGGWTGNAMTSQSQAHLSAEYKLTGERGKVAGSDLSEGSGTGDWQMACQNVNSRIIQGTSKSLQALYGAKK